MSVIISPSILAGNLLNFESEIEHLNQIKGIWLHLDVMDGHFVPNLTFGTEIIARMAKKTQIPLDMHLMVTNPIFHLDATKDIGIHHVTVHWETIEHNWREVLKLGKQNFKSFGISLKPGTEIVSVPLELLKAIDLLLVMSVEPGFYGQKFIASSVAKVEEITSLKKAQQYHFEIQVDGGVGTDNIASLIRAGASNFVAGSAVFKNGPASYKSAVEQLRNTHA